MQDLHHGDDSAPALLRVRDISRRFPGVLALDGVSIDIRAGEMHALAGENGAGKSTLIRVLAGVHAPDAGTMTLDGAPYAPRGPGDAIARGVRIVHQEFNLLPALSIAENILFEHLPRGALGFVRRGEMRTRAAALMARVGLGHLSPDRPVEGLGIAACQLVEIARALSGQGRVLILDEPTAALTPREAEALFEQVRALRRGGLAVVFVSHHLDEIFAQCDRVSVMRNGRMIATQAVVDTDRQMLVRQMTGKTLPREGARDRPAPDGQGSGAEALRTTGLRTALSPVGTGIDLSVRYGEILGIGGLAGSGRTELLRALFGADPPGNGRGGEIFVDGRRVVLRGPRDAMRAGMCLLTEDRKAEGLVLPMSAAVNVTLARLGRIATLGFLRGAAERAACADMTRRLQIRLRDADQRVVELSGGNQQKIVLAKWLFGGEARIILLDEPTRGIDVGAKAEIHALLDDLAARGCAIIVVSSELPELLRLSDRIAVLSRGALVGELAREDCNEERLLTLAYSGFATSPVDVAGPAPSPGPGPVSEHVA